MLYASQCQILQLTVSLKFYYEKIKIKKEEKKKTCSLSEILIKVSLPIIRYTNTLWPMQKPSTLPSYMLNVRFLTYLL